MDWKVVEMMGYAYYCERGWRILVPLVDTSGYDFCIEKDGVFKRVNVKRAGLKDKARSTSWCIAVASGAHKATVKAQTADIFLAYVAEGAGVFVELSGDFFQGTVSKSRCIPTKMVSATQKLHAGKTEPLPEIERVEVGYSHSPQYLANTILVSTAAPASDRSEYPHRLNFKGKQGNLFLFEADSYYLPQTLELALGCLVSPTGLSTWPDNLEASRKHFPPYTVAALCRAHKQFELWTKQTLDTKPKLK